MTVDGSGVATVTGSSGLNFPTTRGAFDETPFSTELYVTRFDPSGSRLLYSTFLGGNGAEFPGPILATPDGRITVSGNSTGNYPVTPHALIPAFIGGSTDSVVTTFDLQFAGVRSLGAGGFSCRGPVLLNATSMPEAGAPFGVYCTQAPSSAQGFLVLQPATASGDPIEGALAWIGLLESDDVGYLEVSLNQLPLVRGLVFRCQAFFLPTPTCPGMGPLIPSNSLLVEVQ